MIVLLTLEILSLPGSHGDEALSWLAFYLWRTMAFSVPRHSWPSPNFYFAFPSCVFIFLFQNTHRFTLLLILISTFCICFLSFPSLKCPLRAPSKVPTVFAQFVLVYGFRFSFMEWQGSSSEKVFANQLDLDPHEGRKKHFLLMIAIWFIFFILYQQLLHFFVKIVQCIFLYTSFSLPFSVLVKTTYLWYISTNPDSLGEKY